ncbi:hypothetical protein NJBCHELONAE_43760 [Mycobacteroides chelonae]|uniref:hypothetical protein n=1 Tax=Mycobacteroides chelonae TaxID=1774 RepID=UPI0021DBC6E3|nr:hypothetical protein [Mycobacteroides chelonae]GLE59065.1 hypothetical protein NJBCHELONAE_43760 [Mycobacteroides chelonae]
MKTLELEWTERKRATVNVPDTYDPERHRDELPYLVGQIDSDSVTDGETGDVVWCAAEDNPNAQVLVDVDPDAALYTAEFALTAHAAPPQLRDWPTPTLRRVILSEAVQHLNAQGDLLQDDGVAQINDVFPVIRPGQRAYVAVLRLTLAD